MIKTEKYLPVLLGILLIVSCFSCQKGKQQEIKPVPFTSVKVTDSFWAPKIKINHEVTIPIAIEQSTISGRIENFEIAAGTKKGQFRSEYPFDDSDIYKIIEAASYSMQTFPDPKLDAVLDTLIEKVGKAQEPDGYLYTCRTINPENPHPWCDNHRWLRDSVGFAGTHELYNCGHLYEAAAAHYRATGKRTLLDIAIKNADLLVKDFGYGKLEIYPGHQIVEMGLVKLYDVTGKKEYLDLAKFFLDVRGPKGEEYCQANKKVIDQVEPVGHAVRATYMYSGMADIAQKYNDLSYLKALNTIWQTLVTQKTYITGGIGSGGGNEGFDTAYVLPNMSAYCETCSSVGNIFWNQRMFVAEGDAKYYDVLERTLYNAFLSGVSLKGDRFYYPNVLESMGQHQRGRWFGCACCPPNVARLLPSLPGYIYATSGNSLYINLFMASTATIDLADNKVEVVQTTKYPWDGKISVDINPVKKQKFEIKIRIPGWAQNDPMPGGLYKFQTPSATPVEIMVNGKKANAVVDAKGYVTLKQSWKAGDKIEINLPMEVKIIQADQRIAADRNKIAVERGPVVYCAEWPDNNHGNVLSLMFDKTPTFNSTFVDTLLNGVELITTTAREVGRNEDKSFKFSEPLPVTLIPYYSWSNRGPGEMMVWLPTDTSSVYPQPAPTIISKSKLTASRMAPSLKVALTDQYQPENSNDHARPYFHWWPINNTWEWVQSDFEKPETVSSCRVYWYDDGPFGGCRIPDAWKVQYLDKGKWKDVKATGTYSVSKDNWNEIKFEAVTTSALKLNVKLNERFSGGIHEWQIQ